MSDSFTGEVTQKIDGKGRVSIPSDFRDVLDHADTQRPADKQVRYILQYSDDLTDHLRAWAVDEIEAIRARIKLMPAGMDRNGMQHLFFTQTRPLSVDKDGRTVIPQEYRTKLGIDEGELAFLGAGKYFEIWQADTYRAKKSAEMAAWLAAKPKGFDPLSLLDGLPGV